MHYTRDGDKLIIRLAYATTALGPFYFDHRTEPRAVGGTTSMCLSRPTFGPMPSTAY